MYKPNDLEKAKNDGIISDDDIEFEGENKKGDIVKKSIDDIINNNKQEFEKIDNIDGIQKQANEKAKNAEESYKFTGWEPTIEDLVKNGPADGKTTAIMKPTFSNDIKAKHTDSDFYIIPMKGLKSKDDYKGN
jgi:hypothetical protein